MSNLRLSSHERRETENVHAGMRQIVIDIAGGTDGHGWPPVTTERVWAKHSPGNRFEIDNVPFR